MLVLSLICSVVVPVYAAGVPAAFAEEMVSDSINETLPASAETAESAQESEPVVQAEFLEPMEESWAFKQYILRTRSEYSKILYLIDRFAVANGQVIYDGYHYTSRFAGMIARWFLVRMYRGQTADKWILQWCNRSILGNELIWVKYPDDSLRLSRDVLLEELETLDAKILELNQPAAALKA